MCEKTPQPRVLHPHQLKMQYAVNNQRSCNGNRNWHTSFLQRLIMMTACVVCKRLNSNSLRSCTKLFIARSGTRHAGADELKVCKSTAIKRWRNNGEKSKQQLSPSHACCAAAKSS